MDKSVITSTTNDRIKAIRKLHKRSEREVSGLFIVDGYVLVREALVCDKMIQCIYVDTKQMESYQDVLNDANEKDINIQPVSTDVMKSMSQLKTPQGIIAVVEQVRRSMDDQSLTDAKILVALDRLQDPGNMGTIIRTADAVGIDGIILGEGCVDVYNDKVIRSAMGSILHLPIYRSYDLKMDLASLKGEGWGIACGHLMGQDFYEREQLERTVLIIGNEAKGVSDDLMAVCDHLWKLPMNGRAESLNAAIAAGIMLYEIVRNT